MKKPLLALVTALLLFSTACFHTTPHNTLANLPTPPPEPSVTAANSTVGNAPQPVAVPTKDNTLTTFVPSIARQVPPVAEPADDGIVEGDADVVDLRGKDLSKADLTGQMDLLQKSMFDSNTVWPASLPEGFNPDGWMQNGLNPGLGVDELHKQGITGKGVNIAMIGEPILTSHNEIKDNLVDYEEFGTISKEADPHSTAVASLLVGKTCGIAPDAKLYYSAASMAQTADDLAAKNIDYSEYKKAFDRIIEINKQMSAEDKIKVVVVDGYTFERLDQGIPGNAKRAVNYFDMSVSRYTLEISGVAIFSYYNMESSDLVPDYNLGGVLARNPNEDVNDTMQYYPLNAPDLPYDVAFPTADRTLASAYDDRDYTFYSRTPVVASDWGRVTDGFDQAYIGGLYALCLQVDTSGSLDNTKFCKAIWDTRDNQYRSVQDGKVIVSTNADRKTVYSTSLQAWEADGRQEVPKNGEMIIMVNPGKVVEQFKE